MIEFQCLDLLSRSLLSQSNLQLFRNSYVLIILIKTKRKLTKEKKILNMENHSKKKFET